MKSEITKISGLLRVLFRPMSWVRVGYYSKHWDLRLRQLMETHNFERLSEHSAQLGPEKVWTSNHPYASYGPYFESALPSRITALRAADKYDRDVYGSGCGE